MQVHARMPKQPSLDGWGLVGGGVVTDDVKVQPGRHLGVHKAKNRLNSMARWRAVSWEMTLPLATSRAAYRLVTPWRV